MVAPFRQFLIVLLVLLQMAAPLVHAHVGSPASAFGGLHLPELEMLRLGSDGALKLASVQHVDSMTAIVELGSAIKLPKLDPNTQPLWYTNPAIHPLSTAQCVERINYSPHRQPVVSEQPFLSDNISRAPPL
jgi:hypothetical protein